MPVFDRCCQECGWTAVDLFEPVTCENPLCPDCGEPTARAWLTKPPNAIGDETDFVSHHGEKFPVRFRSKADHRRWLKQKGYLIKDDSAHHSSTGGKHWLESAQELAKRNGSAKGDVVHDDPLHVTFTGGELTPAQVAEYRRKNTR